MMNLFALTNNSSRRIVRVPLSNDIQGDVEALFKSQESDFDLRAQEKVVFDGKYRPDDGECLVINDFDDIDNLQYAVDNPLSVPEIRPSPVEFESIKALFSGDSTSADKSVLIQSFDKRKILSNKGLSIFHSSNVYKKVDGLGLTLDNRLSAVLSNGTLAFFSFYSVRQMFDLSQYYKEATDEDLNEFAANKKIQINDLGNFVGVSDT
ncbi:hypothetical protein [Beijerinckia sp. L45]|uniref:hypothetical protein n=1 Tax=Beijerinckia sp. L45 TaxID=1641855 RepID=UPI001AED6BDF|nr:hypothetical protein [Beijerinckia sp. L45]